MLLPEKELELGPLFFHIYDANQSRDDIGTDFADAADVRAEAVESLPEILRGNLLQHKDLSTCVINVVDEWGKTVMIVSHAASVETIDRRLAAI